MNRLFFLSIILLFFSGTLKEYAGIADETVELIAMLTWAGIVLAKARSVRLDGIVKIGMGYLSWVFLSGIVNECPLSDWILFGRNMAALLFFYIIINTMDWGETQCRSFVCLLVLITAVQIVVSFLHLFCYGATEYRVGTLFFGGGGMANNLMIALCGYAMVWYYWSSRKVKDLWWLLGLVLIGLASGKRSTVLMYPLFLMGSLFCCSILSRKFSHLVRLAVVAVVVAFITSFLLVYMDNLGGYNKRDYHSLWDRLDGAVHYALEYEDRGYETSFSTTFGRLANSKLMGQYLLSGDFEPFWFGEGPMTCSKRYAWVARERYCFGYGVSGWTDEILSIGVPGLLLGIAFYLGLLYQLIKRNTLQQLNHTGKMLYVGSIMQAIVFLFVHFFYNSLFLNSLHLQIFYITGCVLLINPRYRACFLEQQPASEADSRLHACALDVRDKTFSMSHLLIPTGPNTVLHGNIRES